MEEGRKKTKRENKSYKTNRSKNNKKDFTIAYQSTVNTS